MLTAAYLTASFMVAGIGAWYLLKGKHQHFARRTLALGTAFGTVLIAGQVFIGDILYGTMLKYQPSKMQAAEGFWEKQSQSPAPYYWLIVPDQNNQRNRFQLGIPYLGSIWLTHSLDGRVEGLRNTPRDLSPEWEWCSTPFASCMAWPWSCLLSELLHYGCASAENSSVPAGSFGFWYS